MRKAQKSLPYDHALRDRAKALRKAGMLHEVLLWQRLKKKQLCGLDFDRQKIIGSYIVDFYCASASLVIEIDGSSHNGKVEYDQARETCLKSLGLRVLRLRAVDVLQDIDAVMRYLASEVACCSFRGCEIHEMSRSGRNSHPARDNPPRPPSRPAPPKEGN